jgi:hypothetical protein
MPPAHAGARTLVLGLWLHSTGLRASSRDTPEDSDHRNEEKRREREVRRVAGKVARLQAVREGHPRQVPEPAPWGAQSEHTRRCGVERSLVLSGRSTQAAWPRLGQKGTP